MSQNYFTPWVANVTRWRADEMNAPLGELDAQITTNTTNIANHIHNLQYSTGIVVAAGYYSGEPGAGATVFEVPIPGDMVITFPAGMSTSRLRGGVAATAETVFSIKKNGVEFATATVAIAGVEATMACAVATSLNGNSDDRLSLVAPDPADATFASFGWSLRSVRTAGTTTTTTTTTTSTSSTSSSSTSSTSSSSSSSSSTTTTTA